MLHLPSFPFLIWVACFILGNALLAIIKDCTIQHFRFCNGLPPSSFCKLHVSGGRKDLCSHLHFKRMKKRNPLKLSFKVKLVTGRAGPSAQASRLDYNCGKASPSSSWVFPLPDQVLLLSYCASAGGWQCCWLLAGSVWVLFFHPLIKSCTFLIGEQNLQKRKRNPPFQSIQRLKFIWLWNARQGLNALLRDNCWKPVTR